MWAEPEVGVNFVEAEPLFAGGLQLYAAHRHSFATRMFDDFTPVRNRDSLFTSDHRLGIGANYSLPRALPGEWTLSMVVPMIWREFRAHAQDRVITDRVRGIGDISLGARMRYLWWVPGDDSQRGASLSASVIVDLPTGESGATTSGVYVPRDLQLGRGSFSLTFTHVAAYSNNKLELAAHTSYQWRSAGVGGSGYDFGDNFAQDFEVKYRVIQEKFPGNTMFLALGLMFSHTDYDRDNGARVNDTGASALYLEPKIQWHPKPWWELKAYFSVPIFRDGHHHQLVEELSFRFSVAWRFAT